MSAFIEEVRRNAGRAREPLEVFHLPSVDSTNSWLLDWHQATNATTAAVVIAEEQRAGRGQHGRTWFSRPDDSLVFSYLPPLACRDCDAALLSMGTALAVRDAVAQFLPNPPRLKWPNDIYCGDRKLAGILIEARTMGSRRIGPVIGIGINVDMGLDALPVELRSIATTLRIEGADSVSRPALAGALLMHLDRWLTEMIPMDTPRLIASYLDGLGLHHQHVELVAPPQTYAGVLLGFGAGPAALLQTASETRTIPLAQITALRPSNAPRSI